MKFFVRALVVLLLTTTVADAGPPRPGRGRAPGADMRSTPRVAVGDPVPEVKLVNPADGATVDLRDHLGDKPLVLIFGSFT